MTVAGAGRAVAVCWVVWCHSYFYEAFTVNVILRLKAEGSRYLLRHEILRSCLAQDDVLAKMTCSLHSERGVVRDGKAQKDAGASFARTSIVRISISLPPTICAMGVRHTGQRKDWRLVMVRSVWHSGQ